MRRSPIHAGLVLALLVPAAAAHAQDPDRAVAGGGIRIEGWSGRVDSSAAAQGRTVADARLERHGDGFHVVTGPAVTYWNPANRATGEYTVKATFREPAYMALNTHPHPFGIIVAGEALDGDAPRYLYCSAYGDGRFIMRGFGPAPFQLNGRGEAHPAIAKAGGKGQPVTQEIAVSVREDRVDCTINGTVVGSYPRASIVAPGRLTSTDGIYGFRVGHNAEAMITGFELTTP